MIINTRLGEAEIDGTIIAGTPMVIVTKGIVIPHRKNPLNIPDGGILIPRRYGPNKRKTVMMVYRDIFAALRSRRGASAYYGRHGRGELYRIQRLTRSLAQQIASTEDGRQRVGLSRLRNRFLGDLYDRGRLVSRLDIWATALFLELEEEKATLGRLRHMLPGYLAEIENNRSSLLLQIAGLRLAPFTDITMPNEDGVMPALEQVTNFLSRIEFEEIHIELKELERALSDDIRRNGPAGIPFDRFYAATRAVVGLVERYLCVEDDPSKLAARGDRELGAVLCVQPFLIWVCKHFSDGGTPVAALQLIKEARGRMKAAVELS